MKKISIFWMMMCLFGITAQAQLTNDGFYRVKNVKTARYISIIDNKGSIDVASTQADLGAILTYKYFETVAADPGSIIYFKKMGSEWDLIGQGTSVYDMVGITIQVIDLGHNMYRAFKSASGVSRYLFDLDNVNRDVGKVLTTGQLNSGTANWYIIPVADADEQYLAVTPDVKVGDFYYTTSYTSYGYSFNNASSKAYYIDKIDGGAALWKEVVGEVPPATPVIIQSNSNDMTANKITPKLTTPTSVSGNKLSGTYFCSGVQSHVNRVEFNPSTMRVLGRLSDGSLGFIKAADLQYIPHNTAWINVPANSPDEIKIMNEEEYQQYKEQERLKTPVTLTAVNLTREYGEENPELRYTVRGTLIGGEPELSCEATPRSPVGVYPIVVSRGTIQNLTPELVNGTLTITKAPLTIKTKDYTRQYGLANPEVELFYEGFKNGENYRALPPTTVTINADKTSSPGEYDIVLSETTSQNYEITHQNAKLTITQAPLVISVGDYFREYNEPDPVFEINYTGFRNYETAANLTKRPTAKVQGDTSNEAGGTYPIIVSGAESPNYFITYKNGSLTVGKYDGIQDVTLDGTADVYTLSGARVFNNGNANVRLPKGVYVIKGKKIVVR